MINKKNLLISEIISLDKQKYNINYLFRCTVPQLIRKLNIIYSNHDINVIVTADDDEYFEELSKKDFGTVECVAKNKRTNMKQEMVNEIKFLDVKDYFEENMLYQLTMHELVHLRDILEFVFNGGIDELIRNESDRKRVIKFIDEEL